MNKLNISNNISLLNDIVIIILALLLSIINVTF